MRIPVRRHASVGPTARAGDPLLQPSTASGVLGGAAALPAEWRCARAAPSGGRRRPRARGASRRAAACAPLRSGAAARTRPGRACTSSRALVELRPRACAPRRRDRGGRLVEPLLPLVLALLARARPSPGPSLASRRTASNAARRVAAARRVVDVHEPLGRVLALEVVAQRHEDLLGARLAEAHERLRQVGGLGGVAAGVGAGRSGRRGRPGSRARSPTAGPRTRARRARR